MASKPDNTILSRAKFMDALLAPLPADEEQVDTKDFQKHIERDMLVWWSQGMGQVEVAKARHTIAAIAFRNGDLKHHSPEGLSLLAAYQVWLALADEQCLIPAPTAKEMRWKLRHFKHRDRPSKVTAAIAADEARLAA